MLVTDDLAHRVISTGRDPSGLGQWTWMRLKGPEFNVQIISAYRPVHNTGPETVYSQHENIFIRNKMKIPEKTFFNLFTLPSQIGHNKVITLFYAWMPTKMFNPPD